MFTNFSYGNVPRVENESGSLLGVFEPQEFSPEDGKEVIIACTFANPFILQNVLEMPFRLKDHQYKVLYLRHDDKILPYCWLQGGFTHESSGL